MISFPGEDFISRNFFPGCTFNPAESVLFEESSHQVLLPDEKFEITNTKEQTVYKVMARGCISSSAQVPAELHKESPGV